MIAALLVAALALPCAQDRALTPEVRRALEELQLQSLDEVEGVLGREPDLATARSLAAIAYQLSNAGSLERAALLFEDVLRTRRELLGPADVGTLFAVGQLSRVLLLSGRHGEAIDVVEEHLFEIEGADGLDPRYLQMVLSNHALNLLEWGEVEQAAECMRRSLDLIVEFAGVETPEFARDALNMALILGRLGRWSEAQAMAQEGLALSVKHHGERSREVSRALRVLGMLQIEAGDNVEAESALRRAEASMRTARPVDAAELGQVLLLLGNLESAKGDGLAALDALREARPLLLTAFGPSSQRVLEVDSVSGVVHMQLGDRRAAVPFLERAVAGFTAMYGRNHGATCQARVLLAIAASEEDRTEQAIAELRAAAADVVLPPPGFVAEVRAQIASCLMEAQEYEAAEAELQACLSEIEAQFGGESPRAVTPTLLLASVQEQRGDLEHAEGTAARALAISLAQRGRILGGELSRSHYSGQMRLPDLARFAARLRLLRGDPVAALDALELARGALLQLPGDLSTECEALLQVEEQARSRARALEANQTARTARGEALVEADLQALAQARNALAAAASGLSPCLRADLPVTVTAENVRAALAADEALLAFVWSPVLVAWVRLRPGGDEDARLWGALATGEAEVQALTDRLVHHVQALAREPRARGGPLPELPEALRGLAAEAGLQSVRRVWCLPDGPLARLPLERLFDAGSRPDVVTMTSLSSAHGFDSRSALRPEAGRAVVVGDPSFDARGIAQVRGGGALERLPAARAEARYVARLWDEAGGESELTLGEEATREWLESHCVGARLVHLATHGFPGSERAPYDAALALAVQTSDRSGDWLDALTLDRLLRRWEGRLDGCELVVLSACETNREVTLGTGVYSLAGGFLHAGAGSVLASLWRVDETATALLMGRLAENLTGGRPDLPDGGAPLPPDAALREAQAWLAWGWRAAGGGGRGGPRADGGTRGAATEPAPVLDPAALRPYADPYYWSGFVLLR